MNEARGQVKILIADDDPSVLFALETLLQEQVPCRIFKAETGERAWQVLQQEKIDVALVDLKMADLDGLQILKRTKEIGLASEIILITGHGSIDTAVQAMRMGAYDYLTKPVDAKDLIRILSHAVEKRTLLEQNQALQQQLATLSRYQDLIGKSPAMQKIYRMIRAVAPTEASVLITGESGTGKELVAQAIHKESPRAAQPFLAINCAALPQNILESELFGHEKGAFTGAIRDKLGYFEQANGGTLFLDEITEMPYDLQAKLLRVLETHAFRRLGGQREIQVDVRILAATNRDAKQAVEEKRLRDDLYYRLAVIEIEMPPLRQRKEDIPLMAHAFLQSMSLATRKQIQGFDPEAMEMLVAYAWPGNVRELRNAIERAVILCQGQHIGVGDLPDHVAAQRGRPPAEPQWPAEQMVAVPLGTPIAEMERQLILKTLQDCHNNKTRAAKVLGISLKTLHNKLGRYTNGE